MSRRNFTLIEILMTMTIMAILAGLIVGGVTVVGRKSGETRTKATIAQLETALQQYKQEFGYYPLSRADNTMTRVFVEGVENSGTWYHGLQKDSATGKQKYFLDLDSLRFSGSAGTAVLLDGFNQPLQYEYPGSHNTGNFDMYSKGADKTADTNDDITNWTKN